MNDDILSRHRRAFLYGALACALLGLFLITLIALRLHWVTWAATPQGKNTITWVTFVALAGWLISVAVRDAKRKRAAEEAQEQEASKEWFERIHEQAPVRRVSRADMDAAADRIEAELRTNAMPPAVREWPQPQSPRLTDWAVSAAAPAPLPMRYWLGDPKPMAAADSYTGAAAWTAESFRSGRPIPTDILDAIVPVSGGPRHAWGSNRGTDTQREDPAFVAWEENTGAWPIVRELVGAGA